MLSRTAASAKVCKSMFTFLSKTVKNQYSSNQTTQKTTVKRVVAEGESIDKIDRDMPR